MSRLVPHMRPEMDDLIRSTVPVSQEHWATLGGLANFCQGHGGHQIPWTAIGYTTVGGTSDIFNFRFRPKPSTVARVWRFNLRAEGTGAVATVTCGSATAVDISPPTAIEARRESYTVVETLSAKPTAAVDVGGAGITVAAAGGDIVLESVSMYESTRKVLDEDTKDYGVDLASLRSRQPIADLSYQSIGGVCDAYKNIDARRSFFHYSTPDSDPLLPGSTSDTNLFALPIPCAPAIPTTGDTTAAVLCVARAKVTGGTGTVKFVGSESGNTLTLNVTATSFGWVTGSLTIETEDLAVTDGRQSNAWEMITINAADPAAQTTSVSHLGIYRTTLPV